VTRRAFCVVKSPNDWGVPTRTKSASWTSSGMIVATLKCGVRTRMIVSVVKLVVSGSILLWKIRETNLGSM
jgi:hypothetical protein